MHKALYIFLLMGCGLLQPAALCFGSADTISYFIYLQKLVEIRGITEEALAEENPAFFTERIKEYPDEWIILTPPSVSSGKYFPVSLQWIHHYLEIQSESEDENSKLNALKNLKKVLKRQENELAASTQLNPDQQAAIDKANKILSEKIYDFKEKEEEEEEKPVKDESKPDDDKSGSRMFEAGWNLIILVVVLLVVIFGLLRLLKVIDFNPVKDKPVIPIAGGLLKEDDPRDSDKLQEKGNESYASGDFAAAIRYYYLAFILSLHEHSILNYNPTFTNWEYYKIIILKKFPELRVYFITLLFDESHYGGKEVSQENYTRFITEIKQCISLAKGGKA